MRGLRWIDGSSPLRLSRGGDREMKAHVSAVFEATPLSRMLYNNPIAYAP